VPNEGDRASLSCNKYSFRSPSLAFSEAFSERTKKRNFSSNIEAYRAILKDNTTPDDVIKRRMDFLEAMCRNLIRIELEKNGLSGETPRKE
jgi:hypothetical protein